MSWQEGVAVTVVLLPALVPGRSSWRSVVLWIEFGARLAKGLSPLAWRFVSMRMHPDEKAA